MKSQSRAVQADVVVGTKGRYDYGFTLLPNFLRDVMLPAIGSDAFTLAYLILSWAENGGRAARLGSRYLARHTGWSAGRTKKAKQALLATYPTLFSCVPGEKQSSRPETWWVDLDLLSQMHRDHLKLEKDLKANKRGPGRPKNPVSISRTGFSTGQKPVWEIDTGFNDFATALGKTLFGKSTHPCVGNRHTPVREISTHKEMFKELSQRGGAGGGLGDAKLTPRVEAPGGWAADQSPAARSSSGNVLLQQSEDERSQLRKTLTAPVPVACGHPADAPAAEPSPLGGRADAEEADLRDALTERVRVSGERDKDHTLLDQPSGVTNRPSSMKRPSGAWEAPGPASMSKVLPLPQSELSSRPLASPGSDVMQALQALVGKNFAHVLNETTRTGGLHRREWWPRLTLTEIGQVRCAAQAETRTGGGNMITLVIRGLDRMIGAVGTSAAQESGMIGPVDLSHIDPHLTRGTRCSVKGVLGVVYAVTNPAYVVDLDDGERVTVDRAVARQLRELSAAEVLQPPPPPEPPVVTEVPNSKSVEFLARLKALGLLTNIQTSDER